MDRLRRLLRPPPAYTPIHDDDTPPIEPPSPLSPFSWLEYAIFLLLGIAMLWAWNMFLAAAPYFQSRFTSSPVIESHFQAAETSLSCAANLISMLVLSSLQRNASYPLRITTSLLINIVIFTILALSTLVSASAESYFAFLLVIILAASLSTGLIQNGLFSFSAAFGRMEYTQAIMAGQAVAGILPPLTQILTVLVAGRRDDRMANGPEVDVGADYRSTMIYFLTATAVSLIALLAFVHLLGRKKQTERGNHSKHSTDSHHTISTGNTIDENEHNDDEHDISTVSLRHLFFTLRPYWLPLVLVFTTTMLIFPVATTKILSTNHPPTPATIFIPLAFFVWNLGDLLGRLLPLVPRCNLTRHPRILLITAVARIVWVPLYILCRNGSDSTSTSSSNDIFYLLVVQFPFGLSNGYLASSCMIGATEHIETMQKTETGHDRSSRSRSRSSITSNDSDDENSNDDENFSKAQGKAERKEKEKEKEKAAAGGFMGLMLVAGLTAGSILSFAIG